MPAPSATNPSGLIRKKSYQRRQQSRFTNGALSGSWQCTSDMFVRDVWLFVAKSESCSPPNTTLDIPTSRGSSKLSSLELYPKDATRHSVSTQESLCSIRRIGFIARPNWHQSLYSWPFLSRRGPINNDTANNVLQWFFLIYRNERRYTLNPLLWTRTLRLK